MVYYTVYLEPLVAVSDRGTALNLTFNPITLKLEVDLVLDILKMYLRTENEVAR